MVERNLEMKLNNRTVFAFTRKRPVEIERPFSPQGHGHAAAEPPLGMLGVQYNLRTQPGRVRCLTCGPGELRGCRREHGSDWGRRDTAPLKVQRQLNGVDQEACLQLIYETGHRPESQITTLGLVPRQKVESGEQVTDSFNIPEGFFNCVVLDSQPTKSVPRRVRVAIERNIDEMCPKRNPSQDCNTRTWT